MQQEEIRYQIALTQIPQIGDILSKKLLDTLGSASAIFKAGRRELECIGEIGQCRADAILRFRDFDRIDHELSFMERYGIRPIFYTDADYPHRLRHCADSPVLLYYKGNADLNARRIVNIIGTRSPSAYGIHCCTQMVEKLAAANVMVVSGMAYGIDVVAHQTAVKCNVSTVGVMAHGLDRVYPACHRQVAAQIINNGGMLTDFMSGTQPDKQNFPKRNRIVAGMSDVTIVIESGLRGGSLITASIANSYNRDVMALPGKVNDPQSAGCLELIKNHQAQLITDADDVLRAMGWQEQPAALRVHPQRQLFVTLSEEEKALLSLFDNQGRCIEELFEYSPLPGTRVMSLVHKLEMQHFIKSGPGQKYLLV